MVIEKESCASEKIFLLGVRSKLSANGQRGNDECYKHGPRLELDIFCSEAHVGHTVNSVKDERQHRECTL